MKQRERSEVARAMVGGTTHPKNREINRHNHQRQHPRHRRNAGAQHTSHNPSTAAEAKRNECECTSDGVQDHGVGQAIDAVGGGVAEVSAWGGELDFWEGFKR